MNARDRDKYQSLLAAGIPRERLDQLVQEPQPRARRRTVDRRVLDSALRLDILDAKIERTRREQHDETRARLDRLGMDASNYRPPAGRAPWERSHLERAIEGSPRHGTNTLAAELLIRPNSGVVLAVR